MKDRLKVLVVEDEKISQQVIISMLVDKYDCYVDLAKNATEAFDLIHYEAFEWNTDGYDLIFMAIGLPDINGDELTNVLRQTEAKNAPIIAVTSNIDDNKKKILLSSGFTDVMEKPVTEAKIDNIFKLYLS